MAAFKVEVWAAQYLVSAGHAYVDEQTKKDMRINRGDFSRPGVDSLFRDRSPEDNVTRLREMRDAHHLDGSMVLRAKVKGVINWVGVHDELPVEVRLYDRFFTEPKPDSGGRNFLASLNPHSSRAVQAIVEPTLVTAQSDDRFQFERHGYFIADRVDHTPTKPVFNLSVGLKDTWAK